MKNWSFTIFFLLHSICILRFITIVKYFKVSIYFRIILKLKYAYFVVYVCSVCMLIILYQ